MRNRTIRYHVIKLTLRQKRIASLGKVCTSAYTSKKLRKVCSYSIHCSAGADHDLIGPRYCPSLEAKITRFGHKSSHTIWLEPEGYDSGLHGI